ncbi:MAG: hypothetical protein J6U12_05675, partial [Candidatus Methanomethylophilaceae archaeon]|nr:hypothetical protein [Candidatus Methanomethylophilaceae archaeon]
YPSQIENILNRSELVKESCVIGVPDQLRGSKVKAYVVLEGDIKPGTETMAKLRSYCRTQIARYALPREYEFIDELPRTKVAKVDYRAIEQMDAELRAKRAAEAPPKQPRSQGKKKSQ